ncbi:MAG: serine/threonine-protein kinase, partial [Gemmatimonadales bacterium]
MRQVLTQTATLLGQALQGRYRVEREIGRGGMATVCLAHDLRYDRPVAIKVLHRELAAMIGADRFRREIAITARLDHPNILALLDDGDIDGLPYYVMPFVEGESLAERLDREHQLPVEEALLIGREVADALAYAHGQGVIHRDIKPENILLSKGHAFVADFGIARALEVTGGDRITESGMAVGTPAYMSPEQATASDDIDGRTDIYSLGCVLYEMLAGMPPFVGPTPQAVLARHMSMEMAPAIRTVRVTISESLEGVVMKALAKVPADRFSTAAELRDLLGRPDTFEPPVQSIQSRRAMWVAAAAVVLAAGGFLGWYVTRGDAGSLRTDHVIVFPLVAPEQAGAHATAGEDIAIIIGHTVDGTGALRWVDGWTLLTEEQRGRMRGVSGETVRQLAREQGSARYMTGSVFLYPDSVQVLLALHDVAGDSILARSAESVPLGSGSAWREEAVRAGLLAVNGLLPALIPVGSPDVVDEWMDRNPAAIADFLAAEQLFRRAQSVEALEFYRKSIDADPQFSLAAVRG